MRLVTALCVEQSEEWLAGRVYLDMRKFDVDNADQAPQATEESEEVKSMAAKHSRPADEEEERKPKGHGTWL